MKNETIKSESALSWGHEDLDRICQNLKDFESLLVVFKDPSLYTWGQERAREVLIPNSQQAGLFLKGFDASKGSIEQLEAQVEAENPDAVVVFSSEVDRDKLNLLCSKLEKCPSALIAVFQEIPSLWERFFENCVEINHGSATIRWRDGRPVKQVPFNLTEEAVNYSSLKECIALVGVSPAREKQFKAVLGGSKYNVQKVEASAVIKSGAALVIYEEPWSDEETEEEIQKLSAVAAVFVSNTQTMRTEDRVRCYRSGARLVLAEKSAIEELVAAANSYLFPKSDRVDPFAQLEHENKKYLARIRREASWRKADLNKVLELYKPLISNHFKRAQLLDAEVIVLVIKLPEAPKEIAVTGWQNVFQKALIGTLVSSLRNGDLTLIAEDKLIVIMSAVHSIATKPVLKRMQGHLAQLSAPSIKVNVIVSSSKETINTSEEAEGIIRKVFSDDEMNFLDIATLVAAE